MTNASKTFVIATLDGAALSAAPCGVCRQLLSTVIDTHQIDLATDGREEFLLFTPRLTVERLAQLKPHRDCLLATVVRLTTPQLFLIERQRPEDGSWQQFDLRIHAFMRSPEAWSDLIAELEADGDRTVRATWLAAGVPHAHYPGG
jgi:hypothetical protein